MHRVWNKNKSMHIFIDESGHFQYHSEDEMIVLAAVKTEDPRALRKLVRRVRQAKLSKKQRRISEIKAALATEKYKKYLFRKLAAMDVEIYAAHLFMKDIPPSLRNKFEGVIYLKLVRKLLYMAETDRSMRTIVRMDRRSLKGITAESLCLALTKEFIGPLQRPRFFNIGFSDSQEEAGIQVADFVAHALFSKYAREKPEWYDRIKAKIRGEVHGVQFL